MAEATATPAKKKVNVFLIIAIIVALLITTLIVVGAIRNYRNKKRLQAGDKDKTGKEENKERSSENFPLQIGSKGSDVTTLQKNLNTIADKESPGKYDAISTDGALGEKTKKLLTNVIGASYYPVTKETFNKISARASGEKPKTESTVSNIGKDAYAKSQDLPVYNSDWTVYKKAKAGEFIGEITGDKKSSAGGEYFTIGQSGRLVFKGNVTIK